MEGVSVVICCYNSAARIQETMVCLQNQIVEKDIHWEVIVVDNASADNTKEIAKNAWQINPVTELKILNEQIQGQTYARKTGVDNSKYDYISFVDDDNRVDPNWIKNVFLTFKNHPDCAACSGISTASFEKDEPWWFKYFEANFAVGKQGTQTGFVALERGFLFGAGLSVRKSCLMDLYKKNYPAIQSGRLINELRGGGEDSELCFCFILCGFRLYYNENIKFSHYMPESRMTEKGLKRIQTSIGRDEVVLSIYRSHFNPLYIPKDKWWLEFLAHFKYYLKFLLTNFSISGKKGFLFKTKLTYHHAYLAELVHLRKKYTSYRIKINEFANKNMK